MKKSIIILAILLSQTNLLIAQTAPQGVAPAANTADRAASAWYRGGNNPVGTVPTGANIFGTLWNSPIYTQTFGINRTKLNGNFTAGGPTAQYNINGYGFGATVNTINTSGYLLIGVNGNSITSPTLDLYNNKGAFSLLHLNGATTSNSYQEYGFRPWMKTGITLTGNRDLSYFGLRQIGTGEDITETNIVWSDNNSAVAPGPDDMVFRFTSGGGTATIPGSVTYDNDLSVNSDIDGLHVSRFTGLGLMGLGNTFGVNVGTPSTTFFNTPRSLLHMSYQYRGGILNEPYGFMQITYRRASTAATDIIGQGEQVTDGLRFGIDNDVFGSSAVFNHLNGYLRWQETSSFVIQTEDSKIPSIQSNERMRVTSIGALVRNYNGFNYFGLNDNLSDASPFNDSINDNVTRIAISEVGSQGLTRPKSLLHLGYDYGNLTSANPPEGYRKWMDLGMLTSNNRDHVWIGLKPKDSTSQFVTQNNDKLDAVMAWGTDRDSANVNNVDNMRFIFTGIMAGLGSSQDDATVPSRQYDGLEMMRLYPAKVYQHYLYDALGNINDSTQSYGRVGVGDFTASGVNEMPTHKLDVVGNGRFRYLPDSTYIADSLVTKIVMVDEDGVLRWKSFVPSEFGTYCADTVNGKLDADKKVVLNNHNLYFTNHPDSLDLPENRIGLGYDCGSNLPGKLSVWQLHDTTVNQNTIAGHFMVSDTANNPAILTNFYGAWGEANGLQPNNLKTINNGGYFLARSAQVNFGVRGRAEQGGLEVQHKLVFRTLEDNSKVHSVAKPQLVL